MDGDVDDIQTFFFGGGKYYIGGPQCVRSSFFLMAFIVIALHQIQWNQPFTFPNHFPCVHRDKKKIIQNLTLT